MKMVRGALAEEEGGVKVKEDVEEEQLVDSNPSGRLMLAPQPPHKWILPLSVSAENREL
jgi:hypothetical protein